MRRDTSRMVSGWNDAPGLKNMFYVREINDSVAVAIQLSDQRFGVRDAKK